MLLEQVEADIDNEVQPSRKSKNKGRRVETRKGDAESDRRNSGVQASGFLQNELRDALKNVSFKSYFVFRFMNSTM